MGRFMDHPWYDLYKVEGEGGKGEALSTNEAMY